MKEGHKSDNPHDAFSSCLRKACEACLTRFVPHVIFGLFEGDICKDGI